MTPNTRRWLYPSKLSYGCAAVPYVFAACLALEQTDLSTDVCTTVCPVVSVDVGNSPHSVEERGQQLLSSSAPSALALCGSTVKSPWPSRSYSRRSSQSWAVVLGCCSHSLMLTLRPNYIAYWHWGIVRLIHYLDKVLNHLIER
jgi:hypothetical protein